MDLDPEEEYLRPVRRRRWLLATVAGLLGVTAAVAGSGWERLEVPPSTPHVVVPAPVSQVPAVPPPPAERPVPRAASVPRPTLPVTETRTKRKPPPPTATVRALPAD